VGTENGLYVYNQGKLSRVDEIPADMDVTSIGVLGDGTLIIGGLNESVLYVRHDANWARITTEQGLLQNTAFSIQDDGHGYVWVGGQRGLYRLDIHELEQVADGKLAAIHPAGILSAQGQWPGSQLSHCCNGAGNARVLLDGDRLMYPTREGVVVVNTHKPRFNDVAPTTVVESVEFGGQTHELQPGETLKLPPKVRDIAIRSTVLSFQYPQGVALRYRLLGYDDAWKKLTDVNHRTVFYTNLSPGNYTFEAQGANNAGVWSPASASLALKVQPLFYETWWFRIGAIAVVGLLVYFLFRVQVRSLRLRQLQLERTIMQHTAELRRANTRLEEASQTDPLTGARNRRYLTNQLPADIALFRREFAKTEGHDRRMVFALMDLDNFKQINDTYGHTSGDQALVDFAELLTSMIRQGDYLVRWGGEEFLVILRSVRYDEVAPYAERLWKAVQQYRFATPDDRTLRVTCSLGIAEYPFYVDEPDAFDWESVIMLADRAMYSIKQSGRNGCAIVRPMPGVPASILKHHMEKGHAWLTQQRMLQVHTYRQTPAADAVNT
jgi:diguanylate cyclase (GGDEF)-like protein